MPPLVRREAVESRRDEAAQRVRELRVRSCTDGTATSSPPRTCVSASSETSSSRKNGLPPLRSSSAVAQVVGNRPSGDRLEQRRRSPHGQRIEVQHELVVAPGGRLPALEQVGAGGADEHDRQRGQPFEQPDRRARARDRRPSGGRRARRSTGCWRAKPSMNVSSERRTSSRARVGIDAGERALVAHEVEQAVGDALDLGRRVSIGSPTSRSRRRPAAVPPRADRPR